MIAAISTGAWWAVAAASFCLVWAAIGLVLFVGAVLGASAFAGSVVEWRWRR